MKRLLLDVNVVLDILLDRKPHVTSAAAVWAAPERAQGKGLLAAHGLTAIHCLVARDRGRPVARRALTTLMAVCEVAAVDGEVVQRALALEWPDFEDAVCAAAALASRCDAIVSRDPSGFPDSPVPVIDPGTALGWLTAATN